MSISRNGNTLTLSWKIADKDYGEGQQVQWAVLRRSGKKFVRVSSWNTVKNVGATTTKVSIGIPTGDLYPTDKKGYGGAIRFRVKGHRKNYTKKEKDKKGHTHNKTVNPKWSDWSRKDFVFSAPSAPTLTQALSGSQSNVTTFTWNATKNDSNGQQWVNVEWQSILVKDCGTAKSSDVAGKFKAGATGWLTGTSTLTSHGQEITESTSVSSSGSWARWFRIRARGIAGPSAWVYARHVYAKPDKTKVEGSPVVTDNGSGGYQVQVTWSGDTTVKNPVDITNVQYLIATPAANMACPTEDAGSWTDADAIRDTKGNDKASFGIDRQLGLDQALWVRVNTTHDRRVTLGTPKLAKVGHLTDATITRVQTNDSNHKATITATNGSAVPDSFLAIYYINADNPSDTFVVGIIPHGSTEVTVQCPDWSGQSAVAFGAKAIVGSYAQASRADGADCYTVTSSMESKNMALKGGAVPTPPTGVNVSATSVPGTVRVTWDWSWSDATAAELSWSDHADAWESTDAPDTYEISTLRQGAWNISGLETGVTWYIRVRLKSGDGDNATYGPYSAIESIDLSSAPSIPTLYLSDGVITEDGEVTASWAYTTTDGTAQSYAEICEATVTGGGITYSEPITRTQTAQHITIRPSDPDVNWTAGTTHLLCVRVVSASGRQSDEWSAPVSVMVAEPLSVAVTDTSLVWDTVMENVREYSGSMVHFEADNIAPEVASLKVNITPKQSGTGTPSPDNVRAISGWESVSVYVRGKNLFDEVYTNIYDGLRYKAIFVGNGTFTMSTTTPRHSDGANLFFLAGQVTTGVSTNSNGVWANQNRTVASVNGYVTIAYRILGGVSEYSPVNYETQIEVGTTATEYQPYNLNSHTTTTSLGRTVYGGTLDVVSGVLTVDRAMITIDGTNYNMAMSGSNKRCYISDSRVPKAKPSPNVHTPAPNLIANYLTAVGDTQAYQGTVGVCIYATESANIGFTLTGNTMTLDEVKTYLASNPLQVCYELATPTTYQLTPTEVNTLLGENNVWADAGAVDVTVADSIREGYVLTEMPLTATATGAGEGGQTTYSVVRDGSYYLDRPDEDTFNGHDGETVALTSVAGEGEAVIGVQDLIGPLDDGTHYNLIATISDGIGQSAETIVPFEVRWAHQALIPTATAVTDTDALITKITPVAPAGTEVGDYCDIYRLSADKPELIVTGAQFGQTYVDPFPAIGDMGGHRVVFRTANGDYITEDNELAWVDLGFDDGDNLDINYSLIDFNGVQIPIRYNMDFDNTWSKDFQETQYLGGSVQGDWNPAVSRTGGLNAVCETDDYDVIRAVRRLADYPGICHVRTVDGSSYKADVQVKDSYSYSNAGKIASFSLSITRVDAEYLDGMTLEQWEA